MQNFYSNIQTRKHCSILFCNTRSSYFLVWLFKWCVTWCSVQNWMIWHLGIYIGAKTRMIWGLIMAVKFSRLSGSCFWFCTLGDRWAHAFEWAFRFLHLLFFSVIVDKNLEIKYWKALTSFSPATYESSYKPCFGSYIFPASWYFWKKSRVYFQ